ncbi:SDR family oxidoreductase [bacterium]|nr:MAG: SDR family oxidoreductase [bacterium]
MNQQLKIVVIGGTGLIGSKLVGKLRQLGHEVVAASPRMGINAVTGEGLAEALVGSHTVVDVSNSPSFEDKAVLDFFETSTRNLVAAEAEAGVKHHIALSIVGTQRLSDSGYFRAKQVQEALIKASPIPYTIVQATQFFEFLAGIAYISTVGDTVHLSPALVQPIAADDVAATLLDVTLASPINGTIEIAGPEAVPLNEIVAQFLTSQGDTRQIVTDPKALYSGAELDDKSLTPDEGARLGTITFDEWLKKS